MSSNDVCRIQKTRDRIGEAYAHWTRSVDSILRDDMTGVGVRFFGTLEEAIKWHTSNCYPEYGLTVDFNLEDVMTTTITPNTLVETYNRRVFSVEAIKVEDNNMQAIADWCGGKISTTKTGVPFIEVPTGKVGQQSYSRAFPGSWVVTGRGGYFSSYTDKAFQRTFEKG